MALVLGGGSDSETGLTTSEEEEATTGDWTKVERETASVTRGGERPENCCCLIGEDC